MFNETEIKIINDKYNTKDTPSLEKVFNKFKSETEDKLETIEVMAALERFLNDVNIDKFIEFQEMRKEGLTEFLKNNSKISSYNINTSYNSNSDFLEISLVLDTIQGKKNCWINSNMKVENLKVNFYLDMRIYRILSDFNIARNFISELQRDDFEVVFKKLFTGIVPFITFNDIHIESNNNFDAFINNEYSGRVELLDISVYDENGNITKLYDPEKFITMSYKDILDLFISNVENFIYSKNLGQIVIPYIDKINFSDIGDVNMEWVNRKVVNLCKCYFTEKEGEIVND